MNAAGMPSLRVQTVCVYCVKGLLESDAPAHNGSKIGHALAQKQRIARPLGNSRAGTAD